MIPAVANEPDYGWQARAIHPWVEPRWLTGAAIMIPFGIDLVDHRPGPVLVVEGASDYVTAQHLAAVCSSWPAAIAAPGTRRQLVARRMGDPPPRPHRDRDRRPRCGR